MPNKPGARRPYSGIFVKIGDVIDLLEAEIVERKSRHDKQLFIILRSERGFTRMILFAPEYAINFKKARVSAIRETRIYPRRNQNGSWRTEINVQVDLEEDLDSEATLKAENKTLVDRVKYSYEGEIEQRSEEDRLNLPEYRS